MPDFDISITTFQIITLILTVIFGCITYGLLKRNNRPSLLAMLITVVSPLFLIYIFCLILPMYITEVEGKPVNGIFEMESNGWVCVNILFTSYFLTFGYFQAFIKKLKNKEQARKNLEEFGSK